MKDKLTLSDLASMVANSAEITHKAAEDFLKALFETVEGSLLAKDNLKIKSLGNFKVNYNSPRKSVDVNTGQEITIDGYYKVVFTPDNELKDKINEPFAHLEPVVIDEGSSENVSESVEKKEGMDPLRTLNEQADEIKNILSEMGALKKEEIPALVEDPEEESAEEVVIEEDSTEAEAEDQIEDTEEGEAAEVEPAKAEIKEPAVTETEKKSPSRTLAGLSVVLLLVLVAMALFNWNGIKNWISGTEEYQELVLSTDTLNQDFTVIESDTAPISQTVTVKPQQDVFVNERVYTDFITSVKMTSGNRLTLLSLKYYGAKEFWVYIFEANRDQLKNPDNVRIGMMINIPKLDSALINVSDPRTLEYALKLKDEYVK